MYLKELLLEAGLIVSGSVFMTAYDKGVLGWNGYHGFHKWLQRLEERQECSEYRGGRDRSV